MLRQIYLPICVLFFGLTLTAQEISWEDPLLSKGEVPVDFFRDYEHRVERENKKLETPARRRERLQQEEFVEKSEYYLSRFLASGDVLYGDFITQYCEELVDLLLKEHPSLRRAIRVYSVRSPVVNAAATNSGILLVNHGLIAEIENEAQLAAVLAHEIIHFREKHSINQYMEEQKNKGGSIFSIQNREAELERMSQYSQEHELEADTRGLEDFYLPTGYSHREAEYMMDVLLYSYLPFDEIKYKRDFLERGPVSLPTEYYLDELKSITAREDFDDSKSSHPNIKKRKEAILERDSAGTDGAKYLLSEERFRKAQKLARYENSRMMLERQQYGKALYHSYLLDETYGTSAFTQYVKAISLHLLAQYKKLNATKKVLRDYKKIEGQSQQLTYLLDKLSHEELRSLALAHSYEFWKYYPEDPKSEPLYKETLKSLFSETELQADDFVREWKDPELAEKQDSIRESLSGRSSKIANIKSKSSRRELLEKEAAYHYNFIPYFNDSNFVEDFDEATKTYANEKDESKSSTKADYIKSRITQLENKKENIKESKKSKKENKALGIDRVVCLTPQYQKLNKRKYRETEVYYSLTEEGRKSYFKDLKEMADLVNLDLEFLDYSVLNNKDEERFNDLVILRSFLYERLNLAKAVNTISSQSLALEVMKNYDTRYICFTGFQVSEIPNTAGFTSILLSMLFYPALPTTLYNVVTPNYSSNTYMLIIDTETGEVPFFEEYKFGTNDSPDYRRSVIYNQLLQIKQKSK